MTTMQQPPSTVVTIVKAAMTLHNIIRAKFPLQAGEVDAEDAQGNVVAGAWREGAQLTDSQNLVGNRTMKEAKRQRNNLCDYYNHPIGSVAWQQRAVQLRPYGGDAESSTESDSEVD